MLIWVLLNFLRLRVFFGFLLCFFFFFLVFFMNKKIGRNSVWVYNYGEMRGVRVCVWILFMIFIYMTSVHVYIRLDLCTFV